MKPQSLTFTSTSEANTLNSSSFSLLSFHHLIGYHKKTFVFLLFLILYHDLTSCSLYFYYHSSRILIDLIPKTSPFFFVFFWENCRKLELGFAMEDWLKPSMEWNGNLDKFIEVNRGQHLLSTRWSIFVSQKNLVSGDAVLFLRFNWHSKMRFNSVYKVLPDTFPHNTSMALRAPVGKLKYRFNNISFITGFVHYQNWSLQVSNL